MKRHIEHLADENALANFLRSPVPVYLFIPLEDWQRMEDRIGQPARIVGRHSDMYHHAVIVVVTNR